jgi:hypothetical protein
VVESKRCAFQVELDSDRLSQMIKLLPVYPRNQISGTGFKNWPNLSADMLDPGLRRKLKRPRRTLAEPVGLPRRHDRVRMIRTAGFNGAAFVKGACSLASNSS